MAFEKVADAEFLRGEHDVLRFWTARRIFDRLRDQNRGGKPWSFLDGPITANNPMGVHHAWGRTYKDAFQRFHAMHGRELRYQNGFDCQGLWVEVEVQKEFGLQTKHDIERFGMDRFVNECKKRVLRFAARQTEQSIRLGYWMDWDHPDELRKLADEIGRPREGEAPAEPYASNPSTLNLQPSTSVTYRTASGQLVEDAAHRIVERLGNREWGGSYFTFSTENNETIWTFLKKCHERGKVARGHDVMPWSGLAGSAYSQMEVADGRRLTTHRSIFARFPITSKPPGEGEAPAEPRTPSDAASSELLNPQPSPLNPSEYLLIWTTTPWTLTSNVAAAVNPDLDYVRLQAKRDGAIYYFAKDNLDAKRMEKEFKEGFGRPEWTWPDGTPKLKSLAQIFKEQGGYEVLGTLKGAEMVGWRYRGPFDDLPAQQIPGGLVAGQPRVVAGSPDPAAHPTEGLPPQPSTLNPQPSAIDCHRVIDGGRDNKGNANVTTGEGTGIVHIAPGCGDVDHKLGVEHRLVSIAPLAEDGTFVEGFGEFTGEKATDPAVPQKVIDHLKRHGFHVADEVYPHVYPFCWRTGDELVFRLVDEWFVDMSWRDEIKEVVKAIDWLPPSIQGEERELEWLTNMRDWMISKKRFWGLALPIWVNDEDPSDFDVIGSLAELKDRAVEGWDEFAGHTPHRPWIDKVKIRSAKTGNLMSRVPDVGNPWLDAGIVPFSTMGYNHDRAYWEKWYPADLVLECFPGQFRNWFYSLLSMSTMMRHEQQNAGDKIPFKTLFGHRLVMNELGEEMHKSKGTAIWFEEAAEQLGVDTLRWMYLAQNPAQDLRLGLRHKDKPVVLQTPVGPVSQTREGAATCLVTSKPADEVRRQVLIPLWNSYAFFVNYARLDGFDPSAPPVPYADRPEIDRWVLSNLQALIATSERAWSGYDPAEACRAAAAFIDDLSNWYIRRNRRRFWRSAKVERRGTRDEGPAIGESLSGLSTLDSRLDSDKLAAYQTLYEVLVTLTKLLAPAIPFLSERMYQNLVVTASGGRQPSESPSTLDPRPSTPDSVHLCRFPTVNSALRDPALSARTALAQRIVAMGHKLREDAGHRVRQPLAELKFAAPEQEAAALLKLADVVREELNVKTIARATNLDDLVTYTYKPNLKTLGPKHGKRLAAIRNELPALGDAALAPLRRGENVTVTIGGEPLELAPEDVMVGTEQAADWVTASDGAVQIALSTKLTPDLIREGLSRDFVRQIQQLRKDAGLEIEDRITIRYATTNEEAATAIEAFAETIKAETLGVRLERVESLAGGVEIRIGEASVAVKVEKM